MILFGYQLKTDFFIYNGDVYLCVSGHAIELSANFNRMTIIADITNFLFTLINNLTPYEMD